MNKVTVGTLISRVATVLFSYRMTPQTTTGVSPSELLLGKKLRTRLDLLKPNLTSWVESKQVDQKSTHEPGHTSSMLERKCMLGILVKGESGRRE